MEQLYDALHHNGGDFTFDKTLLTATGTLYSKIKNSMQKVTDCDYDKPKETLDLYRRNLISNTGLSDFNKTVDDFIIHVIVWPSLLARIPDCLAEIYVYGGNRGSYEFKTSDVIHDSRRVKNTLQVLSTKIVALSQSEHTTLEY